MAPPSARARGQIETLPSGSLRVKVYAGLDPVTRRKHFLTEIIPPGHHGRRAAERARTRLLAQLDEQRNSRTRTELIKPGGPWRTVEQVEIATLEYVDWFNHRRLFEACGDIPPAELERAHYRQQAALARAGHSNP
jgi:Integrase core domain